MTNKSLLFRVNETDCRRDCPGCKWAGRLILDTS